jgi:hypothetical protein
MLRLEKAYPNDEEIKELKNRITRIWFFELFPL